MAQVFGGETNATAGWISNNNAVLSSIGSPVSVGNYALQVEGNTTPTGGSNIYKDIQTDWGLSNGDVVRLEFDARHIGSGGEWQIALSANTFAIMNIVKVLINTDTTFATTVYYWTHDSNYRYILTREANVSNNGGVIKDNLSGKKVTFP